jgi:ferredoxin-NADP reductase
MNSFPSGQESDKLIMHEEYIVVIQDIMQVTHDVRRFRFEKPVGYRFKPGQATEVAINKDAWKEERRPFTFTSLNNDPFLEFTIKIYSDHGGVTNELGKLKVGDQLIIHDVWGAIEYTGPGYFIAGGAGITPFIAILRQLSKENKIADNILFFSNKTERDIILRDEFTSMMGKNAVYIVTDEPTSTYLHDFINEDFLKKHVPDFSRKFYVCGPPKMVESINETLVRLGASAESVVFEK